MPWKVEPMQDGSLTTRTGLADRAAIVAGLCCLAALCLLQFSQLTFVDPDLWHEMALFREALRSGRLPLDDRFAYTPTVYPSVQHEWGTGALLYGVTIGAGGAGLMLLKYAVSAAVISGCLYCARRRGASYPVVISLAPVMLLAGAIGFTTIRAQLFTLLFLTLLLILLERDRDGDRRWLAIWLPLYVVWLNLHAGFVVGAALLACHTVEQALRKRPVTHLVAALVAMGGLVAINPYGLRYYPYLARALLLERPLITEWGPLWQAGATPVALFLFSVLLTAYGAWQVGLRRATGLLLLIVSAYAALRHARHLSLYAVVWLCYVPSYLQGTSLGAALCEVWNSRRVAIAGGAALLTVVCLAGALGADPWTPRVPGVDSADYAGPVYPVGAVDYLARHQIEGNLMVPFVPGAYVSWKLHPRVKVSLDSRYEVAYQSGVLEENVAFYQAQPGWQSTLAKYPTDLVLVPRDAPLTDALPTIEGWNRIYVDDAFELYSRPGLHLPSEDRRGIAWNDSVP